MIHDLPISVAAHRIDLNADPAILNAFLARIVSKEQIFGFIKQAEAETPFIEI